MSLLAGFVVVEIAHPLTEYGGSILAGLGADVWLIETPDGADTRRRRPFAAGTSESRRSIPFLARNLNKRSVVIDASSESDRELLLGLLASADVVLDASPSPFHELVEGASPQRLVTVTDDTHLGNSSVVGFAASGGLSSSGWPHQPPCNAPSWLALDAASIYAAAMAVAAALAAPDPGQVVAYDIPYAEAALAGITPWTRTLHSYGMVAAGQGAASARLGAGPYLIFPARDGYFRVLVSTPRQWTAWLNLLGRPEALAAPEWDDVRFRTANFEVMEALASDLVADRTVNELFTEGQALGLTITPVLTLAQVMADPHVRARQLFTAVDDPELRPIQVIRPPLRVDGESLAVYPAPALGQDRAAAIDFVARSGAASGAAPVRRTPGVALPLAGIRVLEFGVGAVVPEGASMMALLGAEVIKVESRQHPDFLRQVGSKGPGDMNNAPSFNQMNLGVLSLSVDMRTGDGRDVIRRLIPTCDVLMENMRGPVMKKWGLDYDSVRALRPDIVYMSSQGLGDGPYGGFQTFGPNLQTFSGVTSLWAHPDDPYPVGTTLNHPDHLAGKQALVALLAALRKRRSTGEGCHLDCTQFEGAAALIGDKFLQQQLQSEPVAPLGNHSPDFAPHGCYPCAGDDQWCALAVETDEQWQAFAKVVGAEWATRAEFATVEGRLGCSTEIDACVSDWTRGLPAGEVEGSLRMAGVPASRVLIGDDFAAMAERHEDGLFACVPHPTAGPRWHTGLPVRERTHGRFPVNRSPLLGEHDYGILLELAGYSAAEISHLAASGAIGY